MTIQPAPETIFNDLLHRAVDALAERFHVSEFELKRIERDIQSLSRKDPAGSFELLAHVAAARGDLDGAEELFARAMNMTSEPTSTVLRHMVVLSNIGECESVLDLFESNRELIRSDPGAIRGAIEMLAGCGWLGAVLNLQQDLEKMGLTMHQGLDADIHADWNTAEVPERVYAAPVVFVHRFLNERRVPIDSVATLSIPYEDGTSSVLFEFAIRRPADQVADLEWDFFGALADQNFAVETSGRIVVAFTSKEAMSNAG